MKEFPILYKYTSKGQPQQWQIIVKDNYYFTREGIVGGVITESQPTYCTGKNLNKSNETSEEAQALLEAMSKHQKKLDNHYNEVLQKERSFFEPMLAHEISKYEKLLFTVSTYIQPKLDGVRCISQNSTLMSRNGKPYLTCPHLYQDEVVLDGELYNHDYKDNFNELISLIKRTKPSQEDVSKTADQVDMWCYDFPTHKGIFSERYKALTEWLYNQENKSYRLVPTYKVHNLNDIIKRHEQFIMEGFEGSIIRLDLGEYEFKRSKQLLKKKDWMDDEFEIVNVIEGEGNKMGMVGSITCKLPNGTEFNSNMKGSWEYSSEVFTNRKLYVGKKATIKFQNYTPDGIPRFPYIIKIDRESYE